MAKVVLVSSLGKAPGVVTGMVDTFRDINEVVVIYTKSPKFPKNRHPVEVRELITEFSGDFYQPKIEFDYVSGIIPYADINTLESNVAFLTKSIEIIKNLKDNGDDVIVSLAGGRKTMSTLISYAAEVCKVDRLYHLIVSKWIEEHGNPETWPASGKQKLETRNRVLHPSETEKNVVRMLSGKDVEELASKSGPVLEQMIKSKLDVVGGLENS